VPLRTGDQTAGMLVMDSRLGEHGPLSRFIAERRAPGKAWRSYEAIATEIREITDIKVTGHGVEKWAMRLGIPDSKHWGASREDRAAYAAAVDKYLRAPRGESTA
jgi:hypothetical protein